jgi:hypothetical protein
MALHEIMTHSIADTIMWAVGASTCPLGQGSRKPADMSKIMRMATTLSNNRHIAVIVTYIVLCTGMWAIRARNAHPEGRQHLKPWKPVNMLGKVEGKRYR